MEKAIVNTSSGQIIIRKDVIAEYAGHVAISTTGIVGMAMISMKDGVYKLLKKESLRKGINVNIENNKVSIDFHVIVAYGVNIQSIAQNVVNTVTYEVEAFTGLKVKNVNIYVEGITIID
jgi:uncharacterized alkaline shock family protein YloU